MAALVHADIDGDEAELHCLLLHNSGMNLVFSDDAREDFNGR
jgi:hypothetical protein